MRDFVQRLYADTDMLEMAHCQRLEDLNLGFGEIYYALGRLLRPSRAVVIGSWRGFAPAVFARAMLDNTEGGQLLFIDPSYVDTFWCDPDRVKAHFAALGVPNVRHILQTTQEYKTGDDYHSLEPVGLLMIDGLHTAEQARIDYLTFLDKLTEDAVVLFHDSNTQRTSHIYGDHKPYAYSVYRLIQRLKATPGLEVFTLPMATGLTLVRGRPTTLDAINAPF